MISGRRRELGWGLKDKWVLARRARRKRRHRQRREHTPSPTQEILSKKLQKKFKDFFFQCCTGLEAGDKQRKETCCYGAYALEEKTDK